MFGGYGFSQEFLTFIERLGSEQIDIAIFLDGVNEIEHSRREISAGKVGEGFFVAPEWLSRAVASQFYKSGDEEQLFELSTLHALRWVKAEITAILNAQSNSSFSGQKSITDNPIDFTKADSNIAELQAKRIWNHYERRIEILNALSERFNFLNIHFLQPNLGTKEQRTDRENQNYIAYFKTESLPDLIYKQGKQLAHRRSNFFDISDCFDGIEDELYIDDHHTGRNGNLLIARCILDDIELILR